MMFWQTNPAVPSEQAIRSNLDKDDRLMVINAKCHVLMHDYGMMLEI